MTEPTTPTEVHIVESSIIRLFEEIIKDFYNEHGLKVDAISVEWYNSIGYAEPHVSVCMSHNR